MGQTSQQNEEKLSSMPVRRKKKRTAGKPEKAISVTKNGPQRVDEERDEERQGEDEEDEDEEDDEVEPEDKEDISGTGVKEQDPLIEKEASEKDAEGKHPDELSSVEEDEEDTEQHRSNIAALEDDNDSGFDGDPPLDLEEGDLEESKNETSNSKRESTDTLESSKSNAATRARKPSSITSGVTSSKSHSMRRTRRHQKTSSQTPPDSDVKEYQSFVDLVQVSNTATASELWTFDKDKHEIVYYPAVGFC
jgi:hypothetical protein